MRGGRCRGEWTTCVWCTRCRGNGLLVYGVPDVGGMDYLCMVYQMLGFEDELGLLVYGVPDVGV